MKLSLFKRKPKELQNEDHEHITKRLNIIKTGQKTEEVTKDVKNLVRGLSDGDG